MARHRMRRALSALLVLMVVACGCGSTGGGPNDDAAAVVAATAEGNADRLALTGELGSTEMLDARTGTITSLDQATSGDRAVLLWYWAPD